MPKPLVSARVDENVKSDVEDYADSEDMTQSEAVRRLVRSGLDTERGVLTDGGEVKESIEQLQQQQRRRERRLSIRDTLTVGAILSGVAVVSGVSHPAVLAIAAGFALALIGVSVRPLFSGGVSDE